jgi:hypothetical protein
MCLLLYCRKMKVYMYRNKKKWISLTKFYTSCSSFYLMLVKNDYLQLMKCIFFRSDIEQLVKKRKLYDAITGLSVVDRNRLDKSLLGLKCCCYSCIIIYIRFLLSPCILLFFILCFAIGYISIDTIRFYIIDTWIQTRFFTFY